MYVYVSHRHHSDQSFFRHFSAVIILCRHHAALTIKDFFTYKISDNHKDLRVPQYTSECRVILGS